MKKQILTGVILLSSVLAMNAQIYTPSQDNQYPSGNMYVGIGTIPDYNLHVKGANAIIALQRSAPAAAAIFRLMNSTNNVKWDLGIKADENDFRFSEDGSSANTRLIIKEGGNIGIGTTIPEGKLAIYGNDGNNTLTFSIYTKQLGTASFQKIAVINPTGSNSNDGYFQLLDNGIVNVNIAANNARGGDTYFNGGGNVGIGTNLPAFKLDVCGTIRANEVKVNVTGNCSDFVFKSDFKLMDLKELEKFVKTNQHLPEIAPEQEMVENGLNMKEFQMKLLQKIEELTLYTIEQNKKIEALEEKIAEVEAASK